MKVNKVVTVSAGALLLVTNITPIFADSISSLDNQALAQVCQNEITNSAAVINQIIDGVQIEQEETVQSAPVYNEVTYSYVQPVYTYEEESVEQTMSVDEFMALFGQTEQTSILDTNAQEAAYQQALVNYNAALAQYESASQMIETTKEIEVEVIEEITDDQGNVTQVSHTEIQSVTEMVPAGDVVSAKANLDAASAAVEAAKLELDIASSQNTVTEQTPASAVVEKRIDETVKVDQPVTYATGGEINERVSWTLDGNGNLVVNGEGLLNTDDQNMWNKNAVKTAKIEKGITSIGSIPFNNSYNLESIIIPEGVTRIEAMAFSGCEKLSSVSIPETVNFIGFKTFEGTKYFDSLPGDFKVINNILVGYTGSATDVTIPSNIIGIAGDSFFNNTSIKSVTLPNSVTFIGDYAFSGCSSLSKVNIPSSVKSIGNYAFSRCSSLNSISIPNGVTEIGAGAFNGCSGLKSISIPNTVTTVNPNTFGQCTALTSVTIPSSVTDIGLFAFSGCTGLTSVTIPSSVRSIGMHAFSGCSKLASVSIPDTVSLIGGGAFDGTPFQNNYSGDFVVLGDGVLCKYKGSAKGINIPNTVKTIAPSCFAYDTTISTVRIPSSVTTIGDEAFRGCSNLNVVEIPTSVTSIGMWAFDGTGYLDSLTDDFIIMGDGVLYKYQGTKTDVTIPSNVKCIAAEAFAYTDVKKVIIPNGVTSIGMNAFTSCGDLTSVTIPSTVKTIDSMAFSYTGLTSLVIPEGVTNIGYNAFMQCENLKTITIPESVQKPVLNAFIRAKSLTDVYYNGSKKEWLEKDLNKFPYDVTIHFAKGLPFTDVPEDAWYYDVAKECYETGLINGTSATTFSPMQTMTRAMVVTILWRMDGQPKTGFNNKFKDVSSKQWYATSISWAVNNGVVNGYGDGTFKPDAAVTREQVAVMLANYATYKKVYKPGTKKLNTYPDGSQVSTWAQAGMKWALTNGIVSGDGAGYLRPKKSATRAEGAAMLLRMNNWL